MKKILAIVLFGVLLYQAGGFALQYLSNESSIIDSSTETVVVKIPINLPYQTDWTSAEEVSGSVRQGDEFYEMKERKVVNDTLVTVMVKDKNARDNFLDFAEKVNEHLKDEPGSAPAKTKLINILVKEYCAQVSSWVFYIIEWPVERPNSIHSILPTQDISSDFFSPPRHA
ncbi:hypothetical protein U0R11_08170 [Aquirufa sp. 1-SAACH-A3]|uniref:Uncharacterized protein n=1 Tax=Aquirufa salirivi TaxID=3104729 RepID=A0ABW8RY39_9BACT